jgi:hypothetical protein
MGCLQHVKTARFKEAQNNSRQAGLGRVPTVISLKILQV